MRLISFTTRAHQLYEVALLTRCYSQQSLRPFIDSEVNQKRYFIKSPFIINCNLSIPDYFENNEPCYKYNKPIRNTIFNFNKLVGRARMMRWCCVNFQRRGVLLIWIRVGQGPTALAVGVGGGCLDIFSLVYHFSFLSPSLLETPDTD